MPTITANYYMINMGLLSALVRRSVCVVALVRSVDAGQGPNELSVTDKDLLPYILGSQGMPKGPSKIYKYGYPAGFGPIYVSISVRREANDSAQRQGHGTP